MHTTFITAGIIAILAAIVGGGLRGLGFEVPVLKSLWRQALLAVVGLLLLAVGLKLIPVPPDTETAKELSVTVKGWSQPDVIRPGDGATVAVDVMTERSTAVTNAVVVMTDGGGGRFLLSGSKTVEGMTNDRGHFETTWTPPAAATLASQAAEFQIQAKVTKDDKVLGIIPIVVNVRPVP